MEYHQVAFRGGWCSGFKNQLRMEDKYQKKAEHMPALLPLGKRRLED